MVDNKESMTAKLCAFARAYHSYFIRDKIADDHLAYDFMGRESYDSTRRFILSRYVNGDTDKLRDFIETYFAPIPIARQKFTETRLERFAKGGKCQYVICGAGADTFSFRNDNEDIEIFEVDHPDTQYFKIDRINTLEWNIPGNVHFVPVDFNKETMTDGLIKAGFDPGKRTFFSILGVSYYLTLPVFTKTLEQIAELSSPGSVLVFDFPLPGNDFPERVSAAAPFLHREGRPSKDSRDGFRYAPTGFPCRPVPLPSTACNAPPAAPDTYLTAIRAAALPPPRHRRLHR